MQNYWYKDVTKTNFVTGITKELNLTVAEATEISDFITSTNVRYYVVFEDGQLFCYLSCDGAGKKSFFTTQVKLNSSLYDSTTNSNKHILIGINPANNEALGQVTFTEDFAISKLYSGGTQITGLTFSSTPVTIEVYPPLGDGDPQQTPAWQKRLCCIACAEVHALLGISEYNCICCFYIGGCGWSCGPLV